MDLDPALPEARQGLPGGRLGVEEGSARALDRGPVHHPLGPPGAQLVVVESTQGRRILAVGLGEGGIGRNLPVKGRHLRGEKRDRRVVVERREDGCPQHQGNLCQVTQHRLDPPPLDPSVHHQSTQKKTHQQRRFEIDAILKRSGGLGKAQEKKQARDK